MDGRGERYVGGAGYNHAVVVGPRRAVCFFAGRVGGHAHPVVYSAVVVKQSATVHPVVCFLCPLGVCGVLRENRQSSTQMEETAVGGGVLVRPAVQPGIDLPAHSTSAISVVDFLLVALDELVEY